MEGTNDSRLVLFVFFIPLQHAAFPWLPYNGAY